MEISVKTLDASLVTQLQNTLGVHAVTARCLLSRGLEDADVARAFLEPHLSALRPPLGLAGLADALPRLVQAAQSGETVGIFGDYDVDGVTTTTLLSEAMGAFGITTIPRVASRAAGYGFGVQQAEELASQCSLIVTGDCGTSDIAAISAANALGCEVIVIDHHTVPDADTVHPALALVNPFREDSEFPFQGMASVGLAFYVMAALRTELRILGHFKNRQEPDVSSWLDLVALGTVADLVPLSHENRIMTAEGIRRLNARSRPGVAALLEVAGVKFQDPIDEHTIGWKLGPRLNAPGRLGDAQAALDVLQAPDFRTAQIAAQVVETINQERRVAQDHVFAEVLKALGDADPGAAVVVAGDDWPHGVVGIIASRLVEMYKRPALVIAINPTTQEGRGSARSFGGVNLYQALSVCAGHLKRFGGHAAAAGLSMHSEQIDGFRGAFHDAVRAQNPATSTTQHCDAEVQLCEIDECLAKELNSLAPFGKGNSEPLLVSRNVNVVNTRRVGDGSHLKLTIQDSNGRSVSAIAFGMGEQDPGSGARIDMTFVPQLSTWNGNERLEFRVKELGPSESTNKDDCRERVLPAQVKNGS